jgi:8-oxo-dGTP pyrophosphatase MutT (NUDIX family)
MRKFVAERLSFGHSLTHGPRAPIDPLQRAAAARRELAEEVGIVVAALVPAGVACGMWDGRHDRVRFFGLRLKKAPQLHLDNREIVAGRLATPNELAKMTFEGPLAAYLKRRI